MLPYVTDITTLKHSTTITLQTLSFSTATYHLYGTNGQEDLSDGLRTLSGDLGESLQALGGREGAVWKLVGGLYEQTQSLDRRGRGCKGGDSMDQHKGHVHYAVKSLYII